MDSIPARSIESPIEYVRGLREGWECNREELATDYELALTSAAVVIPFDRPASRSFATIRRDRSVKPPDAIQLACAAQVSTDLFITNDGRLSDKIVAGVQFITSLVNAVI